MEEEIDIKDLMVVLWKKKWIILITTIVFFIIGIILYGSDKKVDNIQGANFGNLNASFAETDFMLARGRNETKR